MDVNAPLATPQPATLPARPRTHPLEVLIPAALLVAGPFAVLLATDVRLGGLTACGFVAGLSLLTPLALRLAGRSWDPLLLAPVWMLCALGLTVIARVQPTLLATQALWIVLGWSAFIVVANVPALFPSLLRLRWALLAGGIVLTLATLAFGEDATGQGTRLWLRVGPLTVPSAEVLRVALIAFFAGYLAWDVRRGDRRWPGSVAAPLAGSLHGLVLLGVLMLSMLLVLAQGDTGPSIIFVASFAGMSYMATGRVTYALAALALFALGGLGAIALSDVLQERVAVWLDPWEDPLGAGYQSLQAIGGFVFGGVAGTGPGYGYPGLIPAAHTDYPLAVVSEEWGLFGGLALILLYALLVTRGLRRARSEGQPFARLLGAGLMLSLGVQVLVVLAGVLRVLPFTGLTSPLLSYGGGSMMMSWVLLAVLARVGQHPSQDHDLPPPGEDAPPSRGETARIQRTGLGLLAGFAVLGIALGYWQVGRADSLAANASVTGQRWQLETARVTRGALLDRNGVPLAETIERPNGPPRRVYHVPSAVHVVGFDSPWLGATGAEAEAAAALAGRHPDTPLETLQDLLHQDRAAANVRLTIDADLQQVAADALGDTPGAVVALDPRTGDVLALVSVPGYVASDLSEERWRMIRDDPASPLLNRATQGLYPPGSTFKTVTLAAALEHGIVTPDDPAECPERTVIGGATVTSHNEPPGQRTRSVSDAYAYSCNTYFAQLGVEVGATRLRAMAEALGLTEAVPFDLPTSAGRLSNSDAFLSSDGGLGATAFGQGELQLTPLHLALVAAAVANDGLVPVPRLFLDDDASTWRRAMSPETARTLARVMESSAEVGWANSASVPGVRVGAKTGSAEVVADGETHALIIAFAPVDDPQIAVAVVKEYAGAGSARAGPVAQQVIAAWLQMPAEGSVE